MKLISQLILPQRPFNEDRLCYAFADWAGNGFIAFTGSETKHISPSLVVTDLPIREEPTAELTELNETGKLVAQKWALCLSEEGSEFYLAVSLFSFKQSEDKTGVDLLVQVMSASHVLLRQVAYKWVKYDFIPLGCPITISPCGKLIAINALYGGITLLSGSPEYELHIRANDGEFAHNFPSIHRVISPQVAMGLGYDNSHCTTLSLINLDVGTVEHLDCDLPQMKDASLVLDKWGGPVGLYGYSCGSASWYLHKIQLNRRRSGLTDIASDTYIQIDGLALDQVVAPSGTIYTLFAAPQPDANSGSLTLVAHDADLNELSREDFLVVHPFAGCPDPKIYIRNAMLCLSPEENWLGVFLYGDLPDTDDYNFNRMFLFKAVQ